MIRVLYVTNSNTVFAEDHPTEERLKELQASAALLWIDLEKPTRNEMESVLLRMYRFHELAIEDTLNETHHPKIDEFDDHLFVITNGIPDLEEGEFFAERRMNAFIGERYLVTVHQHDSVATKEVMSQCLSVPEFAAKGTDHIYHLILDINTDQYTTALEMITDELESMEDLIFTEPSGDLLNNIIMEKRQILALYRTIRHQKEILNRLSNDHYRLITKKERVYYRDVYDHLIRASDMIDAHREQITGLLSAYLSVTSNKMNEVMKVLTIIATIMLPLTLIAGIYGMNFRYMPELHWLLGYPFALALMVTVSLVFLWYFRKKKWL